MSVERGKRILQHSPLTDDMDARWAPHHTIGAPIPVPLRTTGLWSRVLTPDTNLQNVQPPLRIQLCWMYKHGSRYIFAKCTTTIQDRNPLPPSFTAEMTPFDNDDDYLSFVDFLINGNFGSHYLQCSGTNLLQHRKAFSFDIFLLINSFPNKSCIVIHTCITVSF